MYATKPGGSVHGERENLTRLVLGCIEAKFCEQILNTHVKALAEIYTMHSFAPFGIRSGKTLVKPPRGPKTWGRKNAPGPNNPKKKEKNERRSINSLPSVSAKMSRAEKNQENES